MMEVDQPVVSQVDKEVVPGETTGAAKSESSVASPDKIIEESDDLPALVISDSEGDETPAAEAEKMQASKSRQDDGDISGVTPLDVSVIDVDAKDEDASKMEEADKQEKEEVQKPTQNTVAKEQNKVPPNIYENIDLTGSSSADDSGVSDEGCETTVKKVHENVAKVVKDSSQLTAQELLQSLLGLQQDASDEETPVNEKESTEQREPKSGVEAQLDQEKEVSTPPESDAVGPQEQDENAAMEDRRAEEPESLRLSVKSHTAIAEDTDCVEFDSKQTIESVTVAEAAEKDQGTEKPIPCDSQAQHNRSTNTSKDADDDDDDDDVVCLLEELDDPIGFNKDGEDDNLDGSVSSSADIAPVDGCEGQTKGNENECSVKAVLVKNKESEMDSIGEPPNKRPRSEGHHLDEGVTVEPLENRDNFEIDSIASSQHSKDNHACNIAGSEEKNSESRNAENSHQAESQSPDRSRPASRTGDSMEPFKSLNTADTDANAQDSAPTRPEETQYSDVLVIDDDDDDDAEMNDVPAKTVDKITSVDVEARGKRPRDVDEAECKEKSRPEISSPAASGSSESPVQESSVKRPKSMELLESKPLHMEFMKNMTSPIGSMSRDELEEIVLQKICQAMKYESELVEERKRGDTIVKAMQNLRQRLADMSKQYSDLKVVHDRVVLDLRRKANRFVQPVRITRAVGLQVNQPPQLSFQTFRATNAAANHSAEPSVIPADGNGSPGREGTSGSGTAGTMRDQTTNSAQGTTFVQRVADGLVGGQHPAPNVIRTSRPMNVTFVHGATASAVTIKPTASSRNNGTSVEGGPRDESNSPSGSSSSCFTGSTWSYRSATGGTPNGESISSPPSGSVTARKKTVHKITPKRPPLSAVQQEEQDKMARQQQELFLQDMYNQQARMAKIAANSKGENSPAVAPQNFTDVGQQNAAATTVTQIRTALVPLQASVSPQVSTTSNVRPNNRMAPTITNSMTLAGGKQTAPAATTTAPQQSHPSSAAHNSLIDLTDEEESPRDSSGGGSAPNLSAHNRQNDQNGTPAQPNTPTISSKPPEQLVASNQMLKLSMVARQQNKYKMPQRILNGHVMQRPPASNASAASNPSGTKFGNMLLNRVQVLRPILSKRPPGHILPAGMSSLMNGQARLSGPLLPLYPAGAGQRPQIKLPNHPPPLPVPEKHNSHPQWKKSPPKPAIRINNVPTGIVISWSMPDLSVIYAEIEKYQIYAYQETTELQAADAWRHVGDVNALPLPMAVTLTHFNEGQRYHFAVRAIDQHKRSGHFSEPRTW